MFTDAIVRLITHKTIFSGFIFIFQSYFTSISPEFGAKIQQNNLVFICVPESKLFLMNIYKL